MQVEQVPVHHACVRLVTAAEELGARRQTWKHADELLANLLDDTAEKIKTALEGSAVTANKPRKTLPRLPDHAPAEPAKTNK